MKNSSSSLEDYQHIRSLGSGSYSTVQLVRRLSDSNTFALKKVNLDKLSQQDKQSALNQIRILASVSSPYIISYEGSFYCKSSNSLCILMQYAEQGDLQCKINQCAKKHKMEKGLPEKFIWATFIDILMGLKILHENKIVHRDLKAANIFYSRQTAKIGDFNVSKISENQMYQTKTGTPYYTAPEIWKGQIYTMSCDIWSLGCVIYEMCAMLPPFRSRTFPELFVAISKGTYQTLPLSYSEDLRIIIQACLQVDPDERLTAPQLLQHPILAKYIANRKYKQNEEAIIDMLGPLKCPKILKFINQSLPKPLKSRKQIPLPKQQILNTTTTNTVFKKKTVDFDQQKTKQVDFSPIKQRRTFIGTSIRVKKTISRHNTGNAVGSISSIKIKETAKSSYHIHLTQLPSTNQLKQVRQRAVSKAKTLAATPIKAFRLKSLAKSRKVIEKQNMAI